ncbi:hypothetical protein GGI13_002393 [Coemansia sp. RSA 455]|nr:hypothetical protein GGI13_002393 [Coemansia sp. RSA 455]
MDLQAEPTGFGGILSQNGARSGPGRIHVHHRPSGPTPAHHTTVAIPTPLPTCLKAQEREQILMPETAAHTSPPARPIEPALLWGEQLLPPPMARDFIIGILCFMVGCVVTTVVIRYDQGTVSDGPNDDSTDNDSPNDGGTYDDGNSDQEVSNEHQMPVDNEDADDRSDRPTEPALLWSEQLLPPPMPQYLAISIVSFMVGCVVTTVAIQYGQGTVGEAANDETVAGGDVVDAAHPVSTDGEAVVGGDIASPVQAGRVIQETVAGLEVVDAAQSARTDQGTVDGGDEETVAGDAVDAAHLARIDQANDSGSSSRNRHGQDGADDMAAAAVQQAPVNDNGAVNGSADEQPAGSATEPGNSEPGKKTHRSKRGGVKVRARLERRLERQSNMPAEEPEEPERYGQQSNEDQAPTTAFSSNNRRYNRTKKW